MRDRLSWAILWAQPVLMLLVPLTLAGWAVSAGLMIVAFGILVSVATETFVGVRARNRALAEQSQAANAAALDLGAEITRSDGHARLWSLIDDLAAEARVAPPARITVTLATAAGVRPLPDAARGIDAAAGDDEQPYELVLSATLLSEATIPQLQAVVAHELGHVAARSMTQQASAGHFAQRWAQPFYIGLPPGTLKLGGWLHWQLWAPLDAWASRPGERLADDLAFRVAGPHTTADALRRTERIEAAEALVGQRYLPLATRARLRPSILEGVAAVLSGPTDPIDDVLRTMRPRALDWMHATHPTIAQRIDAANRAAAAGWGTPADERALERADSRGADLLDGGRGWLIVNEPEYYVEAHLLHSAPTSDWETAVDVGWRGLLADAATDLVDVATTPADAKGRRLPYGGGVVAPVHARPDEVTSTLLLEAVERLGAAAVLHEPNLAPGGQHVVLATVSARALDRAGRLRLPLVWDGQMMPEYFDGNRWWEFQGAAEIDDSMVRTSNEPSPLDGVLSDVAAGRASVADLVLALREAGGELEAPVGLTAAERADRPGLFLGAHSKVSVAQDGLSAGETWVVVIGTSGVWLIPEPPTGGWRLPAEREMEQKELLARTTEAFGLVGGPDLTAFPGSRWLPEVGLEQVRVHGKLTVTVTLSATDGTITTLRLPAGAPMLGEVAITALHAMVGNRLLVD